MSIEGKWGVIVVTNKGLSSDRYRLNGYYFSDVKSFSTNEIIAVGSIFASTNKSVGDKPSDEGVILYSTDNGKNWIIIHKSQLSNRFTSISKLSEKKVFIGDINGSGVFLEKDF